MSHFSKPLMILALALSFVAIGCDMKPWRRWGTPEVYVTAGKVTELRSQITVPVVVENSKGELVRAHVVAQPGWLIGPPPPMSEVK